MYAWLEVTRIRNGKKDPIMNVTYYLFAGTFTHFSIFYPHVFSKLFHVIVGTPFVLWL